MVDKTEFNRKDGRNLNDLNFRKEQLEIQSKHWGNLIILSKKYCEIKDLEKYIEYEKENIDELQEIEITIKEYERCEEEKKERLKKWIEEDNAFKAPELKEFPKEKEGELKTLDEIIEDVEPLGRAVNPAVLKIEAIKWLKEDKKTENIQPLDIGTLNFILDRWMKRFNISEEDLLE